MNQFNEESYHVPSENHEDPTKRKTSEEEEDEDEDGSEFDSLKMAAKQIDDLFHTNPSFNESDSVRQSKQISFWSSKLISLFSWILTICLVMANVQTDLDHFYNHVSDSLKGLANKLKVISLELKASVATAHSYKQVVSSLSSKKGK